MITLEQAKRLTYRETIYSVNDVNADGSPQRWRINGKVQLWKRDAGRIRIPIKRGLYENSYLTENNLGEFIYP